MSTIFPKWTNQLPPVLGAIAFGSLVLIVAGVWYYFTPKYWEVGYQPVQPIAFSHQLHAGQLGMDCRYCHSNVEESKHANVPSPHTCMNCHVVVDELGGYLAKAVSPDGQTPSAHWQSEDLKTLRTAYATGDAIEWDRIHKIPDYAHFNHAVHVNAGVSCYSCHQRIDQMPVVYQSESLSMAWCLDCHRAPENHLVDVDGALNPDDPVRITDLRRVEQLLADPNQKTRGMQLAERLRNTPPQHCGACHY